MNILKYIDVLLILGICTQLTSLADFMFSESQKRKLQGFTETLALRLSYIQPQKWIFSIFEERPRRVMIMASMCLVFTLLRLPYIRAIFFHENSTIDKVASMIYGPRILNFSVNSDLYTVLFFGALTNTAAIYKLFKYTGASLLLWLTKNNLTIFLFKYIFILCIGFFSLILTTTSVKYFDPSVWVENINELEWAWSIVFCMIFVCLMIFDRKIFLKSDLYPGKSPILWNTIVNLFYSFTWLSFFLKSKQLIDNKEVDLVERMLAIFYFFFHLMDFDTLLLIFILYGALVLTIMLFVNILRLLIFFGNGLVWRIVTYNKGALSAVTLLLTVIFGILKILLS